MHTTMQLAMSYPHKSLWAHNLLNLDNLHEFGKSSSVIEYLPMRHTPLGLVCMK